MHIEGGRKQTAAHRLTSAQVLILAGFGALLWFGAAMLLRMLAPLGALAGDMQVLTYVLVIPGTLPLVLLGRRLAGLANSQVAVGVAIMTATALLLDGVAIAWFPTLYGADPLLISKSAAAILWGAGVGLVLGLVISWRAHPVIHS